jgi:hypothetical protein
MTISREDREEARKMLLELADEIDAWDELAERGSDESRRLASAIRIVLEETT